MSIIDHIKQVQSRVYAQYRNKPKLMDWLAINGELGNEVEEAYQDIILSYDIDNAKTNDLDVLGSIVGINRSFESKVVVEFVQFGAAQFGAAQFKPSTSIISESLSNDIYKILIKAKIAKNSNDATLDNIINTVSLMVETTDIQIEDPEDMTFSIIFGRLTVLERFTLLNFNIIPKPQGVRLLGFSELAVPNQFGREQFGNSQFSYRFGA